MAVLAEEVPRERITLNRLEFEGPMRVVTEEVLAMEALSTARR